MFQLKLLGVFKKVIEPQSREVTLHRRNFLRRLSVTCVKAVSPVLIASAYLNFKVYHCNTWSTVIYENFPVVVSYGCNFIGSVLV